MSLSGCEEEVEYGAYMQEKRKEEICISPQGRVKSGDPDITKRSY